MQQYPPQFSRFGAKQHIGFFPLASCLHRAFLQQFPPQLIIWIFGQHTGRAISECMQFIFLQHTPLQSIWPLPHCNP